MWHKCVTDTMAWCLECFTSMFPLNPIYAEKDVVAEINKYPLTIRPLLFSQWEKQKRDPIHIYNVQFPNCSWLYQRAIRRMHDHFGEPHTESCGNKCDHHEL